ncbi:MAG: hypothetical protein JXR96_19770 [Deltaproteobacteria bacterium]|nr:hypothetical protein [Deltaproteobacteria bacterium]
MSQRERKLPEGWDRRLRGKVDSEFSYRRVDGVRLQRAGAGMWWIKPLSGPCLKRTDGSLRAFKTPEAAMRAANRELPIEEY